jgi:S1-C subfamily serine protease
MNRLRQLAAVSLLLFIWSHPSWADQRPGKILNAIVKVHAVVPQEARSAQILGTEREGSGVVIDSQGHVLTIGYLILEAERVEIAGEDGKPIPAAVVGYDSDSGFGLVRAQTPLDVPPMELGDSAAVEVGEPLLVAGQGGEEAVAGARVISRQEFAGYWEYLLEDPIFTIPPYPKHSGAALIDRQGRLVGIGSLFTQLGIRGLGTLPCNMFVPINRFKSIQGDLKAGGGPPGPPRPWLGVNLEETHGRVFVIRVTAGGPAEKAGLGPGDIILRVGDDDVGGLADLYWRMWGLGAAGVQVPLLVLQGSELRRIVVLSGDRGQFYRLTLRPRETS